MPLTQLQTNLVCQWVFSRSNGAPFAPTTQGIDGLDWNLADLNVIFNELTAVSTTIAPSSSLTIDLTSLVNLVYESFSMTSLLFLAVFPTIAGVEVGPGASNGLNIFGSTGRVVDTPLNGVLFWGGDPAGTGLTVNSTNKTLKFLNLSGSLTLDLNYIAAGAA